MIRRNCPSAAKKGVAIGSVMLLFTVMAVVGLAAAGLSYSQMMMLTQRTRSQWASSLAEAAVQSAIAQVQVVDSFSGSVAKQLPSAPEGAQGLLSFDRGQATTLGIPYSCNNLKGETDVAGFNGAVVASQTIHLIGVGRCQGLEKKVEVVLYVPRFPYVVSSSGPFASHGGLEILGVSELSALSAGLDHIPRDQVRPGQLVSNALDAAGLTAMNLTGAGSKIHGDVQSAGTVKVAPEVTVTGEVRSQADPVGLPAVHPADYDTTGKPGLTTLEQASVDAALTVKGYARRQGDLTVQGPLELTGGVLYVDGNLNVSGGIRGSGAVIVTGTTSVTGGGSLSSDNLVALLSGGDLSLNGSAGDRASFQGLLYTEGDFQARETNLVGSFIANKSAGSRVVLENSKLVYTPEATDISFDVVTPPTLTTTPATTAQSTSFGFDFRRNIDEFVFADDPDKGPKAYAPDDKTMNLQGHIKFDEEVPFSEFDPLKAIKMEVIDGRVDPPKVSNLSLQEFAAVMDANSPGSGKAWVDLYALSLKNVALNGHNALHAGSTITTTTSTPGSTRRTRGARGSWSLDLSKFLKPVDEIRVQVWRDLP